MLDEVRSQDRRRKVSLDVPVSQDQGHKEKIKECRVIVLKERKIKFEIHIQ